MTKNNLEAAAAGEKWSGRPSTRTSPRRAKGEGFPEVARSFEQIAKVEKFHESRYRKLIENIAKKKVFNKDNAVKWHCSNCGYIFEGTKPPKICPACQHPQSYYEVLAENY